MQPPLPPMDLRFMREDDEKFTAIGDEIVGHLRRYTGLTDTSAVLDVGCGYGRVAHALIRSGFRGEYLGFDILKPQIRWCRHNLANEHMRFRHIDIHNDRYNPSGSIDAARLVLKAPRGSFDVALATSVFTHMWPNQVQRYLKVIGNKLRPGGRAYLTFFLLNRSWRQHAGRIPQRYELRHRHKGVARYMREDNPLHVIAYRQLWVNLQLRRAGFDVEQTLLGAWCGRKGAPSHQDVVIARRLP